MSRAQKALGARVDDETYGRLQDAVIALSGPPWRMTKKKLVTQALTAYITALEKKHNGGEPFPAQKDRRLTPGNRSDGTVGKRKAKGLASSGGRGVGEKREGAAPARPRGRRRRRSSS